MYGRDRFYLYLDYEKNKVTAYPYSSSSDCTTEKVQKGRASSCLTKIIEDGWKMNY